MSWTTDEVPYQCPDLDSILSMGSTLEDELNNIEEHMNEAQEKATALADLDPSEEPDIAEIIDIAASISNDLTEMETDHTDAGEAFFGLDDLVEGIRGACVSLRNLAEGQMESANEEISTLESSNEDLSNELEEAHDELNALKIRNSELERLLNPMIPIPFKTPGLKELEAWESSLPSSPSSSP